MATVYTGKSGDLKQKRFAIVVSTYHQNITGKLLTGAIDTLVDEGVPAGQIAVLHVPGSWELPLAAARLIGQRQADAIICLGCVIRGETTHDQHINTSVSNQLGILACDSQIPIAFGVLTCSTLEQAVARSGGEVGNKGIECAAAAIQMVRLFDEMN